MRIEDEDTGSNPQTDEWFEQKSSNGVQCRVCGSTVQPIGTLKARHQAWHESMDQRPDGL